MLELRIDTDLQTALPAEIGFNFDELKAALAERLEHYNSLIVTEDGIKEAKADRAKLNKLRTAIDTRRKDIKREYMRPYMEFEGKIKELTLLIDQPIGAIDAQLSDYEQRRKQAKMQRVQEAYEGIIPKNMSDIIPLQKIMDQKWLNATTTMKSVEEELQTWRKRVEADCMTLDAVEDEYRTAALKVYMDTLDIARAVKHRDELKEAKAAFLAREAERKARLEAQKAQEEALKAKEEELAAQMAKEAVEAKMEAQSAPGPMPEAPQEKRYVLRLEFNVTRAQAVELRNFIDQEHIEYRKI